MYGPDLVELLDHLGHGVPTPGAEDPTTAATFAVFDTVRDTAHLIGNDMVREWAESNDLSDATAVATLALLEAVPAAIVPNVDAYAMRWRDAHGDDTIAALAAAHGVDLDLLTMAPIPPGSDATPDEIGQFEHRMMRLQLSLMEAASICSGCIAEVFEHYVAHLAADLGYVFQTSADDPFDDPFGPF